MKTNVSGIQVVFTQLYSMHDVARKHWGRY